jgi:hypothetical protein
MEPFNNKLGFVTMGTYSVPKQGFINEFEGGLAPALDVTTLGPEFGGGGGCANVFAVVVGDCDSVDDKLGFCRWEHWDEGMTTEVRVMVELFGFMVSVYVHLSVKGGVGVLGVVVLVSFDVFDGRFEVWLF